MCGTGGGWGAMRAELVMFKGSVFCHMLSITPVLYTGGDLEAISAFCNSLSWEVNKHSDFYLDE